MAEDFYQSESPAAAPEEESGDTGPETALLPKSMFAGKKDLEPGSICKIKVESVMGDEVEVSYVKHDEDKKEDREEKPDDDEAERSMDEGIARMRAM